MNPLVNAKRMNQCIVLCLAAGIAVFLVQPHLPPGSGRMALANVFQLLVLTPVGIGVIKAARGWLDELGYKQHDYKLLMLFLFVVYCGGFLFFFTFFNAEQDIKVYDSTVYWIKVIEDRALIADSLPNYSIRLLSSFGWEYNNLAAFPLIPLSYLLGTEFGGFCLSVFYIYYIPACLLLAILALRLALLAGRLSPGVTGLIVCVCICALSVGFLWPVMQGYVDVAGVLIAAFMLNYTLRWDGVDFNWKRNVVLALLSLLLILTRRWYAYYVVGFYFSFGVSAVIAMLFGRTFSVKKIGLLFLNMGMIAGVSSLCIFLINPDIFILFLAKNYSLLYSAYKTLNLWQNIWNVFLNAGLLWVTAGLAGALLVLANSNARLTGLRLLVAAASAVILFCMVQDMGQHHHYLLLPTVLVFICLSCAAVLNLAARIKAAPFVAVPLLSLYALNFSFAYVPAFEKAAAVTGPYATVMRRYPERSANYETIRHLVSDLREKTQGTSMHAYVVGDGSALSPELLKRSYMPEQVDAAPFILVNSIVDLRDGFPSQLFLAEYVLVGDPFRTEFQTPQQVSLQVRDLLLKDPDFSSYYRLETTYPAARENILLYRKKKPVDRTCVDMLKSRLEPFYPDNPFVYEPDYSIALCRVDDHTSYTYNFWDRAFILQKKAGTPLVAQWNDTSRFSGFSFSVSCWTPGLELIVRDQDTLIFRGPVEVGENIPYRMAFTGSDSLTLTIGESEIGARAEGTLILYHGELK